MAPKSLIWFRADLRTDDNKAFSHTTAAANGTETVAVFIVSKSDWKRHDWGAVRVDFLARNLKCLSQDLAHNYGIPLHVLSVDHFSDVTTELMKFCQTHAITGLSFNNEPEWDERQRDNAVEAACKLAGIRCHRFDDQCIVEQGSILNRDSKPHRVFTPFKNTWLPYLEANPRKISQPGPRSTATTTNEAELSSFNTAQVDVHFEPLLKGDFRLDDELRSSLHALWPAGSTEAHSRLDSFASSRALPEYHQERDQFCSATSTSRLSPYLALGVISARTCYLRALTLRNSPGAAAWISELCWRDFFRHILHHFPHCGRNRALIQESDQLPWRYPKTDAHAMKDYERWCQGRTGFPIVDAAMRSLNATGWLHNRLRGLVASFLTKDLFIDWRAGEKYFMSRLLDGDFASNNGAWQAAASVGTDQKFRAFSPAIQQEKYDLRGEFVYTWVPELRGVPAKRLGDLGKFYSSGELKAMGYWGPVVDHQKATQKTAAAYKRFFDGSGVGVSNQKQKKVAPPPPPSTAAATAAIAPPREVLRVATLPETTNSKLPSGRRSRNRTRTSRIKNQVDEESHHLDVVGEDSHR